MFFTKNVKDEKKLKQKLKKLFADDLIKNPECSSTKNKLSEDICSGRLDAGFTKIDKKSVKQGKKGNNLNRKIGIGNETTSELKVSKTPNNLKKFTKKVNLSDVKNNNGIETYSNGPIATGYVLNGSVEIGRKRKNENSEDSQTSKKKKTLVVAKTKNTKLCLPNSMDENQQTNFKAKTESTSKNMNSGKKKRNKQNILQNKNECVEDVNSGKMNISKMCKPKNQFKKSETAENYSGPITTAGKKKLKQPKNVKRSLIKTRKDLNSKNLKYKKVGIEKTTVIKPTTKNGETKLENFVGSVKNIEGNKNAKKCYSEVHKNCSKDKTKILGVFNNLHLNKFKCDNEVSSSSDPDYISKISSSSSPDYSSTDFSDDESFYDSEYDSEESIVSDELTEYEDESDEYFRNNMKYDFESESNDEDYKPESGEEDLYIPHGVATKYDLDENVDVNFDSDRSEPQIVELPPESFVINDLGQSHNQFPKSEKLSVFNIKKNSEMGNESDSSCPQLIPINKDCYNEISDTDGSYLDVNESEEILDCCSECSEVTDGSLCSMRTECVLEKSASQMRPQIFQSSFEGIKEQDFPFSNYSCHSENTELCVAENILASCDVNGSLNSNIHIVTTLKDNLRNQSSIDQGNSVEYSESKFYNALDSKQVIVLLKEKIHIYGTIKVQLLAGSVDIFGYKPSINEHVELYSPKGYSFLNIKTCKNNSNVNLVECLQKFKEIFLSSEITEIISNFNSEMDAILLFKKNYSCKRIDFLGKYMKENLFPSMNPMQIDRPFYASEFVLRSIIYNRNENELIVDPKWETIKLGTETKLMIIGGKSVGKSTCLRYIINKEIKKHKKIVLVDLDVGQSEVFIPQTISATVLNRPLLGPGYFLNLNPSKAFLYGNVNIVLAPERYLQNIRELAKYCQENEEFKNIPWVINTMGYNKGFGNELIAVLCHFFRPTDILQLQSENIVNNFDYLMEKEVIEKIPLNVFKKENFLLKTSNGDLEYLENLNFGITSMKSVQTRRTGRNENGKRIWELFSKDSRYAMLITRLGTILGEKFDWLTDVKPICCCIDDMSYKSFSDGILSDEEFLDIINANLVYMCKIKDKNSCLECFGIGIVRGVDKLNRKIYLISSVAKENLNHVNCLSVCSMPLPSSIYLNQGPKIKGSVPYTYNTNEFIASKPIKNFSRNGKKKN